MVKKYRLELKDISQKKSHIEDIKRSNLSNIIKDEILKLYQPSLQRENVCKTMIKKYKQRIKKHKKLKDSEVYISSGKKCCYGNEWYECGFYRYMYLKESS